MPSLDLSLMSSSVLAGLKVETIATGLTSDEIRTITSAQIAYLSSAQFGGMTSAQISSLDSSIFEGINSKQASGHCLDKRFGQ